MESSELLKLIRNAINCKADNVPEGWKTIKEYSKEWRLQMSQTSKLLREATSLGLMESKTFRIKNGQRGVYPITHFKHVSK